MRLTIRNSDGSVSQPYPCDWEAVMNKLAEYEDLDEQGRLIKLPCKVGDTVYINGKKAVVTSFYIYDQEGTLKYQAWASIPNQSGYKNNVRRVAFYYYDIGKTVFLTREEAEAVLEGADE